MRVRDRWEQEVLPRLVDLTLADEGAGRYRTRATAGLSGDVVELGFGSGRTLPFYPRSVARVLAVEPADLAWERAQARIASFARPVERLSMDGATLPLPDGSVDAVVSTWTLCTIPEVRTALAEARRVLRPGGELRFAEHSLAPDERVRRTQRRVQPLWGPVAGGCHLDRDLPTMLADAGFDVEVRGARYVTGWPVRAWGWFVEGAARPA
jgi:ubiquinone/menaquinone biosynthesis C-methylase UbiE